MHPYEARSVLRRESARRGERKKTAKEKAELTRNLIAVLQADRSFDPIDFFFGYTLAASSIPPADAAVPELRQQFKAFQEMYMEKLIVQEDVALIIIDSL